MARSHQALHYDKYSEDRRKSAPSPIDIEETYQMFEDFNIPIPTALPYFPTYYKLERWRKKYILYQLNKKEECAELMKKNRQMPVKQKEYFSV